MSVLPNTSRICNLTKSSYFGGKSRSKQFGSRDQVECKSIARLFARAQRPQCTRKGGRQYTYVGALIVSPTSSKIPLLLRFSLPVFHRHAMHLTKVRGSRSIMYCARSKEGFHLFYPRLYFPLYYILVYFTFVCPIISLFCNDKWMWLLFS